MIDHVFGFLWLFIAAPAGCIPLPDQIFPVHVPTGVNATDHGNPNIFCVVPSPWTTLIVFYLGNYAAHAATLITYPGEAPVYIGAAIIYALFFPTSGIARGLNAILRGARLPWVEQTDLCAAARAGALCMVVRTEKWRPEIITEEQEPATWRGIEGAWCKELPRLWPYLDTSLERPIPHQAPKGKHSIWRQWWEELTRMDRKIHGTCLLPDNGYYALAYVPRNAKVESLHKNPHLKQETPTVLSSSYSFVRATIAVIQVLYASSTLYKATRGPQIEQYGYAAFGLTVIPYLIMSVVNLVGNVVTPTYDSLYVVNSPILGEAVSLHNAKVDGIVGNLVIKQENHVAKIQVEDAVLNRVISMGSSRLLDEQTKTRYSGSSKTPRTKEWEIDTSMVTTFLGNEQAQYCVFFTCPVIEREDSVPPTKVLREARRTTGGAYFNRANRAEINIPWYSYLFFTATSLLLGSLSLIPVGIISKFQENKSTHQQRVWTLSWMVFGFVIGTFAGWWTSALEFRSRKGEGFSNWVKFFCKIIFAILFAAPGVGGFIQVGIMLREYGNCVNLY